MQLRDLSFIEINIDDYALQLLLRMPLKNTLGIVTGELKPIVIKGIL